MAYETWKPVLGLEGLYEVSDFGRVRVIVSRRGVKAGRILKPKTSYDGYQYAVFVKNHKRIRWTLQHVVMPAFQPDRAALDNKVRFLDGDRSNCKLANLQWCSPSFLALQARRAKKSLPI